VKPGVFAEQHFHFANQLSFIFSGRAEMAIASANETETAFSQLYDQTDNDQFTLSLATGLNKELDSGLNLSLWVARSQRLASLTERYINFFAVGLDPYELVGNPQIKPETNYQSDLMLSYMGEHIGVQLNGFVSLVDQYITAYIEPSLTPRLPTSPGVRSFQNVDAAFRYGTEVSLMWKTTRTLNHTFDLAYTFAEDLELNEPLPEIAPLDMQYQLHFSQLNNRLNHSIRVRHVLEQNRVSPAFGEIASPSFTTVDYRSQFHINNRIQLSVDLNNLLNEQYTEHLNRISRASGIPLIAPGRSVIVTASYKL
jgi:iron complex outermembrane receptor protein